MPPSRALLRGLGHPRPEEINVLRDLVEWLEHTKIRLYPSEARGPLTNQPDGLEWRASLSKYLADVGCPLEAAAAAAAGGAKEAAEDTDAAKKDEAVASWLVYHALTLAYADETVTEATEAALPMDTKDSEGREDETDKKKKEKVDAEISEQVDAGVAALDAADAAAPAAGGGPPFVDLGSRAVRRACDELCEALGVPKEGEGGGGGEGRGGGSGGVGRGGVGGVGRGTSSLVARLERAEEALTERYLPAASAHKAAAATESASPPPSSASTFAAALLDAQPLGFSTGDAAVDRGARALRWLYVKDLAELQRDVDAAIVAVQDRTADPRTDAALGKVGR